jgi:hypothetical protein
VGAGRGNVDVVPTEFLCPTPTPRATSAAPRVDVEATNDDPPDRVAGWLPTVGDSALRGLDDLLLGDLLRIEEDAARWRDIAETVITHAEDLVRVEYFDQALMLAEIVATEGRRIPVREGPARIVMNRLGRGEMIRHSARQLRTADDPVYERVKAGAQHRSRGDRAAGRGAGGNRTRSRRGCATSWCSSARRAGSQCSS